MATTLLLLTVGAGAFLRLYNIGRYGFWTDELFHVFAARSYLADGSLHVPWEPDEYTRALPVTFLTILSFKLLGESEASARLPFALANIVFILIAYRIIKDLLSRRVALIFAITISLSIFAIQMSQECRMYTLFQLFYFLMSIAFLQGFDPGGAVAEERRGAPAGVRVPAGMSIKYQVSAAVFGLVAAVLQPLAYNFVFVVLVYCLVRLVHESRRESVGRSIRSKYGVLLLSLGILGLVLALTRLHSVVNIAHDALEAPNWNRRVQTNLSYYHQILTESHPFMWAIYPLGAFVAVYQFGRKGLFFVLSFVVLFLMHCFIFARLSERYIFHILPFFIAIGAVAVDFLLSAVVAVGSKWSLSGWQKTLFYGAVCASLTLLLAPRIQRTVLDTAVPKFSNWKGLNPAMIEMVTRGFSVTTDRLRFNYYFGRYPSYVIDSSDVEHVGGRMVIATLPEFEDVVARHPDLILVTYNQHMNHDAFVAPEMRSYILREMERVDREPDARIMVFRKPPKEGQ